MEPTKTPTATDTEHQLREAVDETSDGRYWARTSDLQLVELALSQLS